MRRPKPTAPASSVKSATQSRRGTRWRLWIAGARLTAVASRRAAGPRREPVPKENGGGLGVPEARPVPCGDSRRVESGVGGDRGQRLSMEVDGQAAGLLDAAREVAGPPCDRALAAVEVAREPDDDAGDLALLRGSGDVRGRLSVAPAGHGPDGHDDASGLVRNREADPLLAEVDREDAHESHRRRPPR